MRPITTLTLTALALLGGCTADDDDGGAKVSTTSEASAAEVPTVYGNPRTHLTAEDLERGRMDASWRRFARAGGTAPGTGAPDTASWESISVETVNRGPMHLPLSGDVAGPSVMRVQVLLDRALFSPGIIDGRWGKNTEKAVYWLQDREGLPATGTVDRTTFQRLAELAGSPTELVTSHRLTDDDVSGPFVSIPEDIYEQAELDCMCYETRSEKLAERFHTSPELLQKLNPGVDLDAAAAGSTLRVPNVRPEGAGSDDQVAKLVISDGGFYVHALDAEDRILYHFPSTLGSDYAPSPTGDFRITNIAQDPSWHYQPDLLTGVPDWKEDAMIPPGPNNAVGVVWMQLSKPHYGVHGTSAPETIGYTTSHGCVRLTNWDAEFLAGRIDPGVPVTFTDVDGAGRES